MCGRAAQSFRSVRAAADILGADSGDAGGSSTSSPASGDGGGGGGWRRQNLSPGGRFFVLHAGGGGGSSGGGGRVVSVSCSNKVWGLITRGGTSRNPLPPGPSKHYSNLMFNARSETAASKPSFGRLISSGRSAVVALDGFFEWRDTVELGGKRVKQPYFVYRKDGGPLLLAGLHTSVATGMTTNENEDEEDGDEKLDTFTILTTDTSPGLAWLHTRMPVVLRDGEDARRWIERPSGRLLEELSTGATGGGVDDLLAWHPVTRRMGSTSYRGDDCTEPVKLESEKTRSVASFFGAKSGPSVKSSSVKPKLEAAKVEGDKEARSFDGVPSESLSGRSSSSNSGERPGITVADDEAESTESKKRPVHDESAADRNKKRRSQEVSKRKAGTTTRTAGIPSTAEKGAGGGGRGKITSFFSPTKKTKKNHG